MALVGPRVLNFLTESKVKAAKIQIESLSSALDLYALDTGRYPSSSEGLEALMQSPGSIASWNGPYLKGTVVPKDPWGKSYIYRSPGQHGAYDILSHENGREPRWMDTARGKSTGGDLGKRTRKGHAHASVAAGKIGSFI